MYNRNNDPLTKGLSMVVALGALAFGAAAAFLNSERTRQLREDMQAQMSDLSKQLERTLQERRPEIEDAIQKSRKVAVEGLDKVKNAVEEGADKAQTYVQRAGSQTSSATDQAFGAVDQAVDQASDVATDVQQGEGRRERPGRADAPLRQQRQCRGRRDHHFLIPEL